jgi:hypothetical protein
MVNDISSKLPTCRTYRLVEGGTDTYRSYRKQKYSKCRNIGTGAGQLEKEQLHRTGLEQGDRNKYRKLKLRENVQYVEENGVMETQETEIGL